MIATKEKRLDNRYNLIPQLVDIKGFSDVSINLLTDISLNGLQIQSSEAIENHEDLSTSISLSLKVGSKSITLHTQCVWQKPLEEKDYHKIGCQFLNLSSEQEELINHVIDYCKM